MRGEVNTADEHQHLGWMFTFADLLSLLLVFFVLEYALRLPIPTHSSQGSSPIGDSDLGNTQILNSLVDTVSEAIGFAFNPDEGIEVERSPSGLTVRFFSGAFLGEDVELTMRGTEVVRALAKAFATRRVAIEISTHTDPLVERNEHFTTNWELGEAQAIVIRRQMLDAGFPSERISAVTYSDTRPFRPNRFGFFHHQNRRVELRFTPMKGHES